MISKIKGFDNAQMFHLLWGCALLLMGVAFFFRIPGIIEGFSEYEHFFGTWYVRLSLYLVSIMLIGGGGKKLYSLFRSTQHKAAGPAAPGGLDAHPSGLRKTEKKHDQDSGGA